MSPLSSLSAGSFPSAVCTAYSISLKDFVMLSSSSLSSFSFCALMTLSPCLWFSTLLRSLRNLTSCLSSSSFLPRTFSCPSRCTYVWSSCIFSNSACRLSWCFFLSSRFFPRSCWSMALIWPLSRAIDVLSRSISALLARACPSLIWILVSIWAMSALSLSRSLLCLVRSSCHFFSFSSRTFFNLPDTTDGYSSITRASSATPSLCFPERSLARVFHSF
mmetsp:Transcript_1481/g.3553  ORF Transcript_1481/g.3553 Transcript_1481/m.3553 type:complete len:219 (-) Transcript_1481:1306-1962(-)